VLSVGNGVTDNVFEEDLENTTSLLVDKTGDTLDTAPTSETMNSGLGDTLNIVTKNLAVGYSRELAGILGPLKLLQEAKSEESDTRDKLLSGSDNE